ncbi:MAG: branched-chain amino acid ABC transporter permease [Actinomycetota bacterium]|nr:branched-chain amino acid ABC transporter permease [Actinomycetota bacterium]
MTELVQLVVIGLSTGSAFALVGISFALIFRTTNIVNFAQGAFAVLGGQFTVWLVDKEWPTAAAAIVAVLLVTAVGALVGLLAVGIRGLTTPLASLVITLGVAFVIQALQLLAFGDRPHTYPAVSERAWTVQGVVVQPQYVLIAVVTLVATLLLTLVLRRTIIGYALVATSDSVRAAELVGLSLRSIAVVTFAVSALLSAVAGLLLTPIQPVNYDSDVAIAINGFAAAAFGGLVSIRLAFVGGLVLGVAQQLVVGYGDVITPQARQYELAAALVIMLVLIGWRSRKETVT